MYKVDQNTVECIASGLGSCIFIIGNDFARFPAIVYTGNNSPEPSPSSNPDHERKSFEELLGSYNFDFQINKEVIQKKEGTKIFVKVTMKYFAGCFKSIKEYSYRKRAYKQAYALTVIPKIIGKVFKRIAALDKSFAFKILYQSSQQTFNPKDLPKSTLPIKTLKNKLQKVIHRLIFVNFLKLDKPTLFCSFLNKILLRLSFPNQKKSFDL